MKLNLLPTHVSKEKQNKVAVVLAVLLAAIGIAGAVYMVIVPAQERDRLAGEITTERQSYDNLVKHSAQADEIIAQAQIIIRNINLAEAMLAHSEVYPKLYADINRYIPSFFRVHTYTAAPAGETAVVTLTGTIKTYQQYADLMLALLKNPEVLGVTRSGYQQVDPRVPALTPADQKGKPIRPGESPIPDDPLDRLDYYIAQGRTTGFTGTGGFGTTDTGPRRAMPDWSEITVTMVVRRNLQTPDPRATLSTPVNRSTPQGQQPNLTNQNTPPPPGRGPGIAPGDIPAR